ncbi:hypothetical protein, partial [[Clostridium] innocuum]|uniref:hypothetical protein n=1 Tax=Clostridium innocuum TaxID=1522 RepID=UPI001E593C6A
RCSQQYEVYPCFDIFLVDFHGNAPCSTDFQSVANLSQLKVHKGIYIDRKITYPNLQTIYGWGESSVDYGRHPKMPRK